MSWKQYRIEAVKKETGEVIKGTTHWDGLADLLAVKTGPGEVRYVTSLDTWLVFEVIA